MNMIKPNVQMTLFFLYSWRQLLDSTSSICWNDFRWSTYTHAKEKKGEAIQQNITAGK